MTNKPISELNRALGNVRVYIFDLESKVAALEQRESRVTALAKDGGELFDRMAEHLETSKARIAELEQQLAAERARVVKLPPERHCPAEYAGSLLWSETEVWNKAITTCRAALIAAGIPVEGE